MKAEALCMYPTQKSWYLRSVWLATSIMELLLYQIVVQVFIQMQLNTSHGFRINLSVSREHLNPFQYFTEFVRI